MADNAAEGDGVETFYFGGFKTSTEMEFQAIVDKARHEVAQGENSGSARRSSRRLQKQELAGGDKPGPSGINSVAVAAAKGKRQAPLPDAAAQISVGSRYQAEIVEMQNFRIPSAEQREAEVEKDECWWQPDEPKMFNKDLEDFIVASRRHRNVGIDMAMRAVYHQKYDVVKALEHMEEEYDAHWKSKFTKEEDNALVAGLRHFGKYFGKIAKKYVKTRTVGECARRYYDIKKQICYNTNEICPTLMRSTTEDYKTLKRSECENCSINLFERVGKCEVRGRRKTMLCPPCDMYAKLKKMYRPSTVRFEPVEGELSDVDRDKLRYETTCYFDLNQYMMELAVKEKEEEEEIALFKDYPKEMWPPVVESKTKSECVYTEPHNDCFFIENAPEIRWDMALEPDTYDKEKAVDGFLRYGKNFAKIAAYAGMKNDGIARQFYDVYAQDYRLDFLIAHYNARHQTKAVLGHNHDSDEEDEDDDDGGGGGSGDGDNYIVRRRMTMKARPRKATVRTRAATLAGTTAVLPLRRTTRQRKAVREMS